MTTTRDQFEELIETLVESRLAGRKKKKAKKIGTSRLDRRSRDGGSNRGGFGDSFGGHDPAAGGSSSQSGPR